MRIYPHLQDTGGFFIAVLQKSPSPVRAQLHLSNGRVTEGKRQADTLEGLETNEVKKQKLDNSEPLAVEQELVDDSDEANTDNVDIPTEGTASIVETDPVPLASASQAPTQKEGAKAKGADIHFKENPYTFLSPDDPILQACISQLNLSSDFPATNMLVRNPTGDTVRSLYMTNDTVKQIVEHNDYTRMRLMTCGTKVMAKQEGAAAKREGAESQFRILSEGLPAMLPYVKAESILTADVVTLKILMETYYPVLSGFPGPFRAVIESKAAGCHIVRFEESESEGTSLTHDLVLPIWKSNVSITLMIEKKAKSALSLRVFGEDITTAAREATQKKQDALAASANLDEDISLAVTQETEEITMPTDE